MYHRVLCRRRAAERGTERRRRRRNSNGSDRCGGGRGDMSGGMSHVHLHFVRLAEHADLTRLHFGHAALKRERHRLRPEVRLKPIQEILISLQVL